jgi:dihydrofolate synthase / folylpolyglutamate synthase
MPRSYNDTLQYLYDRLPMFQRIGSTAYKKDLGNTRILCAHLEHPEGQFKSIHVAGSNGKGSVCHMLAAAFQSAGLKVGLYTSPHLKDFRERIRINGEMISQEAVIDFVANIEPVIEEIDPSFFEVTVAMAFAYFAAQKVDIAIIETGLGGRLDSTNVISPVLSVITNISYDHTQLLGNTLEEIAGEKAGIIKPDTPVVIGRRQLETNEVFSRKAAENNAELIFAENLKITEQHAAENLLCATFSGSVRTCTDLRAAYQLENLRTVVCALLTLTQRRAFSFDLEKALAGIARTVELTGLRGRWQVIAQNPLTVLDGAHNPDGIAHLMEQLSAQSFNHLHLVFGAVREKDVAKVLKLLPGDARYYFTQPPLQRALPVAELQALALEAGLKGEAFTEPRKALAAAQKNALANDMILVTGSLFLVAEFA